MVRQNLNHPSIVLWSVGNETGFVRVNRYAEVVKAEDPTRPVTYASNTGKRSQKRYPDLDFIAHNSYRGWYHMEPWDFEAGALEMRYISETGGGEVISNHTDYARPFKVVDHFEPEEYRQRLAELQFQVVFRDHPREIPMYLVWILRELAIGKYKGRNTKGLLTYSNFKKDAYYLYQSFLRPDLPVVHITSKTYFGRVAICAWLAGDAPLDSDQTRLVEEVCEGFLCPSLGTAADYEAWFGAAGLEVQSTEDWTSRVTKTWEICHDRVERSKAHWIAPLGGPETSLFVKRFKTMLSAYRSGAMKYGCFIATRRG